MEPSSPLTLESFLNQVSRRPWFRPDLRVLVGFSGGADSTCLLHLAVQTKWQVTAGHLHHGMRSEADAELLDCESFATTCGANFVAGRADVPKMARELGVGLEEAGRNARYEFFRQIAFNLKIDLILTAHTLNDRVESMFLNLARGTGLNGLSGIPEHRDQIVRPLLSFSRAETEQYCLDHTLPFHHDPSNDDLAFARVKVRKQIIPAFASLNTGALAHAGRLADLVSEESRFLDEVSAAALEKMEVPLNGNLQFVSLDCEVALSLSSLRLLPIVLRRRSLQLLFKSLGGQVDALGTASLNRKLDSEDAGAWTSLGGDVILTWSDDLIHLQVARPDTPFRFPLTLPGETVSDYFGWQIIARESPESDFRRPPKSLDIIFEGKKSQGELYFRAAQTADRIQPLGMTGTRLLSDVFGDMKLTEAAKRRLPIVCDMVGPIWIPGGPMADRVKIEGSPRRPIRLTFEPLEGPGRSY